MRPDVNVYMTLACRYYTNTMITEQGMSSACCYCFILTITVSKITDF